MIVECEDEQDDEYFDVGCVHGAELEDCLLCNPETYSDQSDPEGEQWPADEVEAAGQIPEELWALAGDCHPTPEELDAHYQSIAEPYGGAL